MAFVYFVGRVNLVDAHQMTGSKEVVIRVDDVAHPTPADQRDAAEGRFADWITALDNIIDAVITGATMSIPVVGTGLKTVPGAQGVATGANLVLSTEDLEAETHERPYWLPAANSGIFLANFKTVDTGDTALLTWLAEFNDGTDIEITISDKEKVLSIVEGEYATRRRNSSS